MVSVFLENPFVWWAMPVLLGGTETHHHRGPAAIDFGLDVGPTEVIHVNGAHFVLHYDGYNLSGHNKEIIEKQGKSITRFYGEDAVHTHIILPAQPNDGGSRDNYPRRHRVAPDGRP